MDEAYVLCDEIAIMDHGKIIAQGTPKELLAEHFDDVILQLPETDVSDSESLPFTVHKRKGVIEITTCDVDQTIEDLLTRNISLARLQIRSRNLDDLFLELTGKELRS
jgi:ABC-2 type transport system ATP-binding protein